MYNLKLREKNFIDLPDIIFITRNLLSNCQEVLNTYQHRYKYIIVDEFQDTNHIQLELIDMLGRNSYVTVCGDDDQAIYGWRGATNDIFKEFRALFPNSGTEMLNQNYRSTQQIVEISQNLIKKNKLRDPKDIFSNNEQGNIPEIIITETVRQEAVIVSKMIKCFINQGYAFRDIAILYRLHKIAKDIIPELSNQGIPLRTKNKPIFLDKNESNLISYLRVISNPKDEGAFMNILNWPKRGLGDSSKLRLKNTASMKNLSLVEALEYLSRNFTGAGNKGFTELFYILKYFKENISLLTPREIILKLMSKCKIEKEPQILIVSERFNNPGKESLDLFLESVDCCQDPNVITLSSIHQAKGQEWSIIFLVRVNEGVLPAGDDIEEERRLAYVAATRAKKILIVTCSMSGSKGEPIVPSRFVDELFDENLKTKKFEINLPSTKKIKIE